MNEDYVKVFLNLAFLLYIPLMESIRRTKSKRFVMFIALLYSAVNAIAQAPGDYYHITYEGGKRVEVNSGPIGTLNQPYTLATAGIWTGWWGSHEGPNAPMSHTCNGKIKVKFKWMGHANDVPKSLIINERSIVRWQAAPSGSGSCDNALGDTAISISPKGQERGTNSLGGSAKEHVWVMDNPSAEFFYEREPTSEASNPMSHPVLSATVKYQATSTPVLMNLQGTIKANGYNNILMGQRTKGTLTAGSYSITNYNWTVYLDVYYYFFVSSNLKIGYVVPVDNDMWTREDPTWRWKGQADLTGWMPVECTATVWLPDGPHSISASQRVELYSPEWDFSSIPGTVHYEGAYEYVKAGDWTALPPILGMIFKGAVETPPPFDIQGTGDWQFSHLIDLFRSWNDGSPNLKATGGYHLDNSWPYAGPWPASSALVYRETDDSPAHYVATSFSFLIEDSFKMYQLYRPPYNGLDSDWAPLNRYEWAWNASGSRVSTANPFSPLPPGTITSVGSTSFPEFPSWNDLFTNI